MATVEHFPVLGLSILTCVNQLAKHRPPSRPTSIMPVGEIQFIFFTGLGMSWQDYKILVVSSVSSRFLRGQTRRLPKFPLGEATVILALAHEALGFHSRTSPPIPAFFFFGNA